MQRSSESIGAIAGALAKAQIELANPEKSLQQAPQQVVSGPRRESGVGQVAGEDVEVDPGRPSRSVPVGVWDSNGRTRLGWHARKISTRNPLPLRLSTARRWSGSALQRTGRPGPPVCPGAPPADLAGWVPRHYAVWSHVPGHHGTRPHHGTRADDDAGKDDGPRSDPRAVTDLGGHRHGLSLLADRAARIGELVSAVEDQDLRAHHDVPPDPTGVDPAIDADAGTVSQETALPAPELGAVLDVDVPAATREEVTGRGHAKPHRHRPPWHAATGKVPEQTVIGREPHASHAASVRGKPAFAKHPPPTRLATGSPLIGRRPPPPLPGS